MNVSLQIKGVGWKLKENLTDFIIYSTVNITRYLDALSILVTFFLQNTINVFVYVKYQSEVILAENYLGGLNQR